MNKKYIGFGIVGMLVIGLAVAGYVYNNFVIKSDVYEPFTVEYAVIGDGGQWDGVTHCDADGLNWFTATNGQVVDMAGLYAGEGRLACARITNLAEAPVDFDFSYTTSSDNESAISYCVSAFGEGSTNGEAIASGQTLAEIPMIVADGATPVNDCLITIEASRG